MQLSVIDRELSHPCPHRLEFLRTIIKPISLTKTHILYLEISRLMIATGRDSRVFAVVLFRPLQQ